MSEPFDYRSLSHRLIGRVHACKEDWANAAAALRTAIDLSPDYAEGNYEYAQYCVQSGDRQQWIAPLREAILAKPAYWYMAWAERNFAPVRKDLASLLKAMRTEARKRAVSAIAEADRMLEAADRLFSNLCPPPGQGSGTAHNTYSRARQKLTEARDSAASADYSTVLKAAEKAAESMALAQQASTQAVCESGQLAAERARRLERARFDLLESVGPALGIAFGGWVLFGVGGCVMRSAERAGPSPYTLGAFTSEGLIGPLLVLVGWVVWGLWRFNRTLEGK